MRLVGQLLLGIAGACASVVGCAIAMVPVGVPTTAAAPLGCALVVVGVWTMLGGLRS